MPSHRHHRRRTPGRGQLHRDLTHATGGAEDSHSLTSPHPRQTERQLGGHSGDADCSCSVIVH